jgi:hypothetical protein
MLLKPRSEKYVRDITRTSLWDKMITTTPHRIVPIISNSFRINQLFCDEAGLAGLFAESNNLGGEALTIEEQLTQVWARKIRYPLSDSENLSRVAHFHQIECGSSVVAKQDYIDFLKSYLLDVAASEPGSQQTVDDLAPDAGDKRFAELASQLKFPRFPANVTDPLSLLARLPLPIYVTTSYFDFLERALHDEAGKNPRSFVIHWNEERTAGAAEAPPGAEAEEGLYEPSVPEPAVYHLFGFDKDPQSLVMSEDDFLKFLITVVSDSNTLHPVVPLRLRQALAQSYLLLLGYQLKDWEFRILFRFLLEYREDSKDSTGIFIQVQPKSDAPNLLEYLSKYFGIEHFDIAWRTPERFIRELWQAWKGEKS